MPTPAHATDLPRDPEAVNPARLADSIVGSGLFAFPKLRCLTSATSREGAVRAVGGPGLEAAESAASVARHALEATFTDEQRALYLDASDARNDAALLRSEAESVVAQLHGIAVGAALAACSEGDTDALVRMAGQVGLGALLLSELPPESALQVGRSVLDVLSRAVSHG